MSAGFQMSESFGGGSLSSTLPRFVRWMKAIGVDPETVPSYHNQSQFWLEWPPAAQQASQGTASSVVRLELLLAADGSLTMVARVSEQAWFASVPPKGPAGEEIVLPDEGQRQGYLQALLENLSALSASGAISLNAQLCVRDGCLCLMQQTSVDQTLNARSLVADFMAAVSVLREVASTMEQQVQ